MKLRSLALLLGLVSAAAVHAQDTTAHPPVSSARPQIGVYIAPTAANITASPADTGTFAFLGDSVTSRWFKGATMGAYYDFAPSGSLKFGVDIRDRIIGATTGARANSFLVGLRAVYVNTNRIHPYAEAVVGVVTSHSGTNPATLKRAEFGGLVGADYTLTKHLDWRAVEIGFGSFSAVSSEAVAGAPGTTPSFRMVTVASGFVAHF